MLTVARGELDRAEELLDRALQIVERFDDLRRRAFDSAFRGQVARARGDHAGAAAHHDRARALYAQLGNAPGVAWSHYDLGLLDRRRGDVAGATEHLGRASPSSGTPAMHGPSGAWRGRSPRWSFAGASREAAALLAEALDGFEAAGDGRGLAQSLEATAGVACEQGAHRSAGQLLGAAAVLRERLAAPLPDEDRGAHHALSQQVRRALGPERGRRGRGARGAGCPNAQVGAIARRVLRASQLTPREQQVARLIASGRTNRQIGRELGIAEKTTEVHVHHIIGKLGARCRSEVAAWVGAQGAG